MNSAGNAPFTFSPLLEACNFATAVRGSVMQSSSLNRNRDISRLESSKLREVILTKPL
jgi:hypothetical protein